MREAVRRGELSSAVDPRLLLDALGGALHIRMFATSERVDDVIIGRIVDLLLHGVIPEGATRRGKPARATKAGRVRKA